MLAGVYLAYVSSLSILLVLGAGILGSVLYTADPVVLKARALGEVNSLRHVGATDPPRVFHGPERGVFLGPSTCGIPIGILVALVLLANNIRDTTYDGSVGNRTLAVVLGTRPARPSTGSPVEAPTPWWSSACWSRLPPSGPWWCSLLPPGPLVNMFKGAVPDNADPRTAALAFQFALLYMGSLLLSIIVPA